MSFSLKQHGRYESVKVPDCQSIPGQLKSPPRKIFEFGYFTLTSAIDCDRSFPLGALLINYNK